MINSDDFCLNELIEKIKIIFESNGSGHDFEHVMRVYKLARHIANVEKCDLKIVSIAALVHDIGDYKLVENSNKTQAEAVKEILSDFISEQEIINKVVEIVEGVSFKGNGVDDLVLSLEGQCVRDADRLDAMGAIGVARAFAYGALKQRKMYDNTEKADIYNTFDDYKNNKSNTINHFYEKLLLLKNRIQTKEGKRIAEKRHKFLETFLSEFLDEWNFSI